MPTKKSAKKAARPPGRTGKKSDKWGSQRMLAEALATCGRRGLRREVQGLQMEDILRELRRMQRNEAGDEGTLRNRVLRYRILELCPDNPYVERADDEDGEKKRQEIATEEVETATERTEEEEENDREREEELEEDGGGEEPVMMPEAEGGEETETREKATMVAPREASPIERLRLPQSQVALSRQASGRGSPAASPSDSYDSPEERMEARAQVHVGETDRSAGPRISPMTATSAAHATPLPSVTPIVTASSWRMPAQPGWQHADRSQDWESKFEKMDEKLSQIMGLMEAGRPTGESTPHPAPSQETEMNACRGVTQPPNAPRAAEAPEPRPTKSATGEAGKWESRPRPTAEPPKKVESLLFHTAPAFEGTLPPRAKMPSGGPGKPAMIGKTPKPRASFAPGYAAGRPAVKGVVESEESTTEDTDEESVISLTPRELRQLLLQAGREAVEERRRTGSSGSSATESRRRKKNKRKKEAVAPKEEKDEKKRGNREPKRETGKVVK